MDGFKWVVDAAGGAGGLFLAVSMAAAGWAVVAHRALPVVLGWIGVLGGATTVLTIFSPDTALSGLAGLLYVLSLLLAIVFRVWAGITRTTGRVDEWAGPPYRTSPDGVREG